ncbi:hypothetical protein Tco_1423959, partial [Tanacetum coccineum]
MNMNNLEDDEFELLFGEGPSQPIVEESLEESLVKEVVPVKRKYVKRRQSANKNDKDVNEPWTPEEEVEETQPVDRDKTKRMGSTSAARSASSSAAADTGLVDTLRQEEAELERLKLAQAKKFEAHMLAQKDRELKMQEKMFALPTRR